MIIMLHLNFYVLSYILHDINCYNSQKRPDEASFSKTLAMLGPLPHKILANGKLWH